MNFTIADEDIYSIFGAYIYKYDFNEMKWIKGFSIDTAHLSFTTLIINNDKMYVGCEQKDDLLKLKLPNLFIYSQKDGSVISIRDTISGLWQYAITSFAAMYGKIYVGTTGGLFVSTDEGMSWVKKNRGLRYEDSLTSYDYGVNSLYVKGDYIYAITSDGNVAYSRDEGESWNFPDPYNIIPGGWISSIGASEISSINNKLLIKGDDGLYISSDTITDLQNITGGTIFCGDIVRDIATNGEKIYAVVGYGFNNSNAGLWESTDNGDTWKKLLDKNFSKIAVKDSFIIVGDSFFNKNPYYSTNGGKTFNEITTDQGLQNLQTMSIKIYGDTVYVGTRAGIYISADWGQTWSLLNSYYSNSTIYCMEFFKDYILAGIKGNTILMSSDKGINWTTSIIPFNNYDLDIVDIKIIGDKPAAPGLPLPFIYLGTSHSGGLNDPVSYRGRGVFISSNSGISWIEANSGLLYNLGVSSIEESSGTKFISMNTLGGVYYATGIAGYYNMWKPYNKGLTNSNIYKLLATEAHLFAGTDGGLYRLKLSDVGILDVNDYAIERKNYFYSYPPYPLPAGEVVRAKIFWDLALNINTAEIKVYDVYGKEISDGKDIEIIPEGDWNGTLVWNCKGVTPGVYLIAVNYGTERKVIKVVKG